MPSPIPHIHLLTMDPHFSETFNSIFSTLPPSTTTSFPRITIHNCSLSYLPSTLKFDAIVSPANSYGRLDGGFDDAISRAFSPKQDYLALTRHVQSILYDDNRGFLPPGSCKLFTIPKEFDATSKNIWATRYLALCPTMRVPRDTRWDREVVYECLWGLFCEVERWNRAIAEGKVDGEGKRIESMLMTPLATGCGFVSAERWARQMILAIRHYVEAVENPGKWRALDLGVAGELSKEVEETWNV
ncbi:macro domain-like protein [Aspergillus sclerotioniger CBS 115572]|uniref:Macro domain-like protein n=1 Tax=Aspergillus sclerotioniger CBS 115572 TaxID=1450535 RepID=A0A317V1U6_9EURO|nr:macro domain-like protein [Aspergillus sclerotioniger CBS 115572]PWY67976.1 macro domain-like protein [Aspergillus sclerotioniger CBS 115572]